MKVTKQNFSSYVTNYGAVKLVDFKIIIELFDDRKRQKIRINIKQTESRQITVCIRFPSNYPSEHLLVELKSLTISGKMLDGLTTLAEQKASESLGKPQTLHTLKFIDNYLRENPLCIAFDEIFAIKQLLRQKNDSGSGGGELKCLQKTSNVSLVVNEGDYYYKAKYHVPEEYPIKCIDFIEHKSNFPDNLLRFLNGQAKEIARKCVEPPLHANIKSSFVIKPSVLPSLRFLIEAVSDFTSELCPVCNLKCLPAKASDVELRDTADLYAERVYCGHIYHLGCLKKYMREPPFPLGGKTCPAKKPHPRSDSNKGTKDSNATQPNKNRKGNQQNDANICGIRISHDRWALNVKLAEARWAQQQARERELEEVIDFLQ